MDYEEFEENLKKTVEFFYIWKMSFLCREYIFHLTTDIGKRALLRLPTFYVNYIISIIIIYSYNQRSRRIPHQNCFENFVSIIFPYVDYPSTFLLSPEDSIDNRHNNPISRIAIYLE